MIKKIILMVVVTFLTIPLLTHAQTVTIEDAPNQPPGSVSLNINMSGFANTGGAVYLQIEYDDNLLEYIDYTSAQSFLINPNYLGSPVIALNWANFAGGAPLNGTFITLNFTYNGGFSNTLEFIESVCEIADLNGNPISGITYVNGTITPDLATPPDGTATLGSVLAVAGGDAVVPLRITDDGGFSGIAASTTLRIGYDTEKLVYSGVSDNSLGFTAGEKDGVITLAYNGTTPLSFPLTDPLLKIDFDYLGGGVAAVDFLSGSIVTDAAGTTILVTRFEDGQVDVAVPPGSGKLTIDGITADPGEVAIEITAAGIPAIPAAGVLELRIAYDANLVYKGFSSVAFPAGWTSSQTPGYLTFSLTNPSGFTIADGEVLTLRFDYSVGLANIKFKPGTLLKDTDSDPIPLGLIDGYVTPPLTVKSKVYLQGPWNGTTMNTSLLNNNVIPLAHPYSGSPWNYAGSEIVDSVPSGVVDWILIELRTSATSAAVGQRAGFLLSDGRVVDVAGVSPVVFGDGLVAGDYFIVIKHRNHLAIMSATAQPLSGASVEYDFTDDAINTYGTNGIATLSISGGGSAFGMLAADANADNTVFVQDLGAYAAQRFSNGYLNADFNMDGTVFVQDLGLYAINRFFNSQVPF